MKKLSLLAAMVLSIILLYSSFASLSVYAEEDKPQVTEHKITKEERGKEFTCVVCGMKVKVAKNTPALDYKGNTYYFCASGEKAIFSKDPEKYITQESPDSLQLNYTEHKITDEEIGEKATCPVMKRSFTVSKDTPAIEYRGETYYFCCPGCIGKFMTSQTEPDSLKVTPDSLHHNKDTGGTHKHKGCC
ncbi:MAG: YHS domain-containing protein [candidate division Zixibacteria bacterium]|nr:YHS domain-containing protein [candidate division Zixibacteria bacterium]